MRDRVRRARRGGALPGPEWVRNRLGAAFAVLLLLVVGLVVASALVARDLHDGVRRRLVDDALPLRHAVFDLQTRLLDEETAVRGFLVTGREAGLGPYRTGRVAVARDLLVLRPRAARHAHIAELLGELEPEIAAVQAFFAHEVALVRRGPAGQRAAQAQVERGRALFDRLRASSGTLLDASDQLVTQAVRAQDRRYRDLLVLLGVVGGAAVLLVLLLALRVPRRILALVRAERAARERSERLEAAEHASRERAERLDEVAAALSSAITPAEIAAVCLDAGGAALEAQRGWLGLLDPAGRALRLAGQRGYPEDLVARWAEVPVEADAPAADVVRSRQAIFLASREQIAERYPALVPVLARTGDEAWAVLPLPGGPAGAEGPLGPSGLRSPARPRGLGALLLAFDHPVEFDAAERRLAREIAERCSRALERGREYELQRHAAETLQRGALPEVLPAVEGLELAAVYAAGAEALEVGGDWYDAFTVPGRGEVAVVVGDVVGKGVEAASTMARLRNALRAYALDGTEPAAVLGRLDELWTRDPPTYATAVLASLDLASLRLRLAVAGHPPPLLLPAHGEPRFLDEPRGTPLGATLGGGFRQAELQLGPGDALVLYSDGLVEARDLSIDVGLQRLRDAAWELRGAPLDVLVPQVVARCLEGRRQVDDVVVLAVRVARLDGGAEGGPAGGPDDVSTAERPSPAV